MDIWQPDISLRLSYDKIHVRVKGGDPNTFYAPDFQDSIYEVARPLLGELNAALNPLKNIRGREKAARKIEQNGKKLFNVLFQMSSYHSDIYLDDFLKNALEEIKTLPVQIVISGDWYGLPWELIKLPDDWDAPFGSSYLGEVATISGTINEDTLFAKNNFDIQKKLQIVSLAGHRLPHANDEASYLQGINSRNIHEPRIVCNLPKTKAGDVHHGNYSELINVINNPIPAHFLHGAFHSETANKQESFSIILDKGAKFTAGGFKLNGKRPSYPQIAFFNTCQGISPNAWFGGGFGVYALKRWNSNPVVTSIAKISDKDATRFSKDFMDRILPLNRTNGDEIGNALYLSRKEWFKQDYPGRFLGFSYRILGNSKRYFQIVEAA